MISLPCVEFDGLLPISHLIHKLVDNVVLINSFRRQTSSDHSATIHRPSLKRSLKNANRSLNNFFLSAVEVYLKK